MDKLWRRNTADSNSLMDSPERSSPTRSSQYILSDFSSYSQHFDVTYCSPRTRHSKKTNNGLLKNFKVSSPKVPNTTCELDDSSENTGLYNLLKEMKHNKLQQIEKLRIVSSNDSGAFVSGNCQDVLESQIVNKPQQSQQQQEYICVQPIKNNNWYNDEVDDDDDAVLGSIDLIETQHEKLLAPNPIESVRKCSSPSLLLLSKNDNAINVPSSSDKHRHATTDATLMRQKPIKKHSELTTNTDDDCDSFEQKLRTIILVDPRLKNRTINKLAHPYSTTGSNKVEILAPNIIQNVIDLTSSEECSSISSEELHKVELPKDPRQKQSRDENNAEEKWGLTQLSQPQLSKISAEFAMHDSIDDELLSIDLDLSINNKSFGNFARHKSMPAHVSKSRSSALSLSSTKALKRKISDDNVGCGNKLYNKSTTNSDALTDEQKASIKQKREIALAKLRANKLF